MMIVVVDEEVSRLERYGVSSGTGHDGGLLALAFLLQAAGYDPRP